MQISTVKTTIVFINSGKGEVNEKAFIQNEIKKIKKVHKNIK